MAINSLKGVLLIGSVVLQLLVSPTIRVADLCVPVVANGVIRPKLRLPVDLPRLRTHRLLLRRWRICLRGWLLRLLLSLWLRD